MTSPVIEEFTLPESLDSPGADDFRLLVDLRNAIARESLGPAALHALTVANPERVL